MKYAFIFLFPFLLYAQNAEEIVAKNLEVTGDYSNWMSLQTIQLKGEIKLGMNDIYPIAIYQKRPNWTLSIIQIKGKNFILEGYNGKKAIQNDFTSGKIVNIPNYIPENFDSDLLNYASKGFSLEFLGKTNVEGKSCYKIALNKNKNTDYYYFATDNYYLLKEENNNGSLLYSNFKKTGDFIFPYSIESINTSGDTEFLLSIKTMIINRAIDEKLFNF